MKEILIIGIAILAVCWMIRKSCRREELPPKAQLLRDMWHWAEGTVSKDKQSILKEKSKAPVRTSKVKSILNRGIP